MTFLQPKRGHRIGSDAALLAAAADLAEGRLVDVGAGVGAVGLAILRRSARSVADLVEIDPALAAIAAENAARNGLAKRARAVQADLFNPRARRAGGPAAEAADLVVTNPPFFEPGAVRVSSDWSRARAHVFAGEASNSGRERFSAPKGPASRDAPPAERRPERRSLGPIRARASRRAPATLEWYVSHSHPAGKSIP